MQILEVKNIVEFETAEVPEGSLLVFPERQDDGSYLWRCKDSEGNTGTIGTGVESVNGKTGTNIILEHADLGAVAEDLNAEYGRPDTLLSQMMFFIRNGAVNLYATLADLKNFLAGFFADINHIHSDYANIIHAHIKTDISDFAHDHTMTDITGLQLELDDKSVMGHVHVKADITDFDHGHSISEITNLQASLDGKAAVGHNHDTVYSGLGHSHNEYALTGHNHDIAYAAIVHTHSDYSLTGHVHDGVYAVTGHSHAIDEVTGLQTALNGKAAVSHNHNTVYAAINHDHSTIYAALGHPHGEYALTGHNHNSVYSAIGHGHAVSDVTGLQTSLDGKQTKAAAYNLGTGLTGAISLNIANGDTQYGALSGAATLAYGAIGNLEEGQGFILQLDNAAGQTFEFTSEIFGNILILDSGNTGIYKTAFSKVNGKICYDGKSEVYC